MSLRNKIAGYVGLAAIVLASGVSACRPSSSYLYIPPPVSSGEQSSEDLDIPSGTQTPTEESATPREPSASGDTGTADPGDGSVPPTQAQGNGGQTYVPPGSVLLRTDIPESAHHLFDSGYSWN